MLRDNPRLFSLIHSTFAEKFQIDRSAGQDSTEKLIQGLGMAVTTPTRKCLSVGLSRGSTRKLIHTLRTTCTQMVSNNSLDGVGVLVANGHEA
jgi:hypothetical protein